MNIVVFMSHSPRVELMEAYFVSLALPYFLIYKTSLWSVTLGWVYVVFTEATCDVVAGIMVDMPVKYMGPWEYVNVNDLKNGVV